MFCILIHSWRPRYFPRTQLTLQRLYCVTQRNSGNNATCCWHLMSIMISIMATVRRWPTRPALVHAIREEFGSISFFYLGSIFSSRPSLVGLSWKLGVLKFIHCFPFLKRWHVYLLYELEIDNLNFPLLPDASQLSTKIECDENHF